MIAHCERSAAEWSRAILIIKQKQSFHGCFFFSFSIMQQVSRWNSIQNWFIVWHTLQRHNKFLLRLWLTKAKIDRRFFARTSVMGHYRCASKQLWRVENRHLTKLNLISVTISLLKITHVSLNSFSVATRHSTAAKFA